MRGQRQRESETQASPPANADATDVERGIVSAPPAYEDVSTPQTSFLSDISTRVLHIMTTLPFGIGTIFRTVTQKGGRVVAGDLLVLIIAIGAGSAFLLQSLPHFHVSEM